MKLIAVRDEHDKDIYHLYEEYKRKPRYHVAAIHIDLVTNDMIDEFLELCDYERLNLELSLRK